MKCKINYDNYLSFSLILSVVISVGFCTYHIEISYVIELKFQNRNAITVHCLKMPGNHITQRVRIE